MTRPHYPSRMANWFLAGCVVGCVAVGVVMIVLVVASPNQLVPGGISDYSNPNETLMFYRIWGIAMAALSLCIGGGILIAKRLFANRAQN